MSVFNDGGIWPKESVYVVDGMIIISADEHLLAFCYYCGVLYKKKFENCFLKLSGRLTWRQKEHKSLFS